MEVNNVKPSAVPPTKPVPTPAGSGSGGDPANQPPSTTDSVTLSAEAIALSSAAKPGSGSGGDPA